MAIFEARPRLWVQTQAFAGLKVNAALVLADRYAVVVDTLLGGADMGQFLELIRAHGRPVLVINTHGDWDHIWGNVAFPGAPIIGHRLCRERILASGSEEARMAEAEFPGLARVDPLIPPDVVFDDTLSIAAGNVTLQLQHLPGHTADSIVARIPEWGVCIVGDTVEDPIPTVDPSGSPRQLRAGLVRLMAWQDGLVIPGHGVPSGPQLVRDNLAYVESIISATAGDKPCPYITEQTPRFYHDAHAANVAAVRREAGRLSGGPDGGMGSKMKRR